MEYYQEERELEMIYIRAFSTRLLRISDIASWLLLLAARFSHYITAVWNCVTFFSYGFLDSIYGGYFDIIILCALSSDKCNSIFQYALYIYFVCIYVSIWL